MFGGKYFDCISDRTHLFLVHSHRDGSANRRRQIAGQIPSSDRCLRWPFMLYCGIHSISSYLIGLFLWWIQCAILPNRKVSKLGCKFTNFTDYVFRLQNRN